MKKPVYRDKTMVIEEGTSGMRGGCEVNGKYKYKRKRSEIAEAKLDREN